MFVRLRAASQFNVCVCACGRTSLRASSYINPRRFILRPFPRRSFGRVGRSKWFLGVLGDPRTQAASFSDLWAFAGFRGRLWAFCGRFAGNSGRRKRRKGPILQSHEHIGVRVVLGDFIDI